MVEFFLRAALERARTRLFMDNNTILVLANPTEPFLTMLEALPPGTSFAVGKTPEAFERAAPDATVIFSCAGKKLLEPVWRMAPKVRWVHSRSAGLDNVLFPALVESAVLLTNGRGVFSESLGEFAIGAALFFAKEFRRLLRNQAAGVWEEFHVEMLAGKTMGIVGYGDIGRAVARRAKALGMRVLALRRDTRLSEGDPFVDAVFPPEKRIDMISQSDYIVAAAPLTPATRGLVGEAEIRAMKPTAVFMNIGRGPVVDEAALIRALEEKRIRGAALDVFEKEPLVEGHPFYRMENVLLSPHCADHTHDWQHLAMQFFLDNFERFRKGEPLLNLVDKKRGY
jgi:phosphoglycerate dehydrogenase-like enzyme